MSETGTKAAFTKGPWRRYTHKGNVMICAGPVHLATVAIGGNADEESDFANAQLIAASPDLFAALSDMLDFHAGQDDDDLPMLKSARAALARAKGGV